MVQHKEFETAGKVPGLQVWRVEKSDLVPVPKENYGDFFTGDSYLLLYTTASLSHKIYMWLGNGSSALEKGGVSIFALQLDDYLGKSPQQFREVQDHESIEFKKLFKSGIKYKKGGVASGLKHVSTKGADVKRLLHLKGRHFIRANEVEMSWDSFNTDDVFIIDLGEKIYQWRGSESNLYEHLKATEMCNDIRDNERSGRAEIEIITEGSEPEAVTKVLGTKTDLPPATKLDNAKDTSNRTRASLYKVSDLAGDMRTTLVSDHSPFKQAELSLSECYLIDNGVDNIIFVWKGKDANTEERKAALKAADHFITENNYPEHTQIQILPAGAETSQFKLFFWNWLDKEETTGPTEAYTTCKIAQVEQIPFDPTVLHSSSTMAAQHGMVDDGSGKVEIWRVEDGDKVPLEKYSFGQFFGGDCYLVLYTYNTGGREQYIIYTWQGLKCTKDELVASAFLTVSLDKAMDNKPVQVRVTQGEEPPHLVSLFKRKPMTIFLGGKSRDGDQTPPGSTRLFQIRQSSTKSTRAVEVEPTATSLNSNDVFVLKSPDSLWVWKGLGANEGEIAAAYYVTGLLGGTPIKLAEKEETPAFWSALGGEKDYQTSKSLRDKVRSPRLFACSNKTGNLIAEEVPPELTQLDLATDDIMLLDTWDQIFLWIGNEANETEKKGSPDIAKGYLESDPSGRSGIAITTINQGAEPPTFTGWFPAWDPKMWD